MPVCDGAGREVTAGAKGSVPRASRGLVCLAGSGFVAQVVATGSPGAGLINPK